MMTLTLLLVDFSYLYPLYLCLDNVTLHISTLSPCSYIRCVVHVPSRRVLDPDRDDPLPSCYDVAKPLLNIGRSAHNIKSVYLK